MRLLCVDLGNICRGPMAEAVLRRRLTERCPDIVIDSAGIDIVTAGVPPDPRAIAAAGARGYRLDGIRCRALDPADCEGFTLLLAVDRYVLDRLRTVCTVAERRKARLLHPEGVEIADPYEGSMEDFGLSLDMIEEAVEGLAIHLRQARGPRGGRGRGDGA